MNFLNPGLAAAGLACIAVPILIHILMRRRRKPVAWGAMRFLLAAYRQQRRRMNFEQWLLLVSRCVIVALVALAVGKPVLAAMGASKGAGSRTVYVLLDNSLTSGVAPGAGAKELDGLKERAKALLAPLSMGGGDRAGLVTLAGPAKAMVLPAAPDATQVSQMVDRIEAAASRADMEGAVRLVRQAISEDKGDAGAASSGEVVVAVFSSFRSGAADFAKPLEALSTSTRRVRVVAVNPADIGAENVSIRSVLPLRSLLLTGEGQGALGATLPVRVELVRSGGAGTSVTQVRGWVGTNQERAATVVVNWSPGQREASAFLSVDAMGGSGAGDGAVLRVETSADALAGDNMFVRPLETMASLRVALIAPAVSVGGGGSGVGAFSSQDWLALALSPQTPNPLRSVDGTGIRLEVVDPARLTGVAPGTVAPELAGAGAVIVTQPQLLDAGGWRAVAGASRGALVMIVPPENESLHTWTDAMSDALGVPWKVSREATPVGGAEGMAIAAGSTLSADEDLLGLVRPEMEELVKVVRVRQILTLDGRSSENGALLSVADGAPLVVASRAKGGGTGGLVVLWLASPALAWTDLPAKPLMVPLLQELVRQGAGRSGGQKVVVAGGVVKTEPGATELAAVSGSGIVRVAADGSAMEAVRDAGLWRVREADGRTRSLLAVNHDPQAGDTTTQRSEDVQRWLSGLSSDVSITGGGAGDKNDERGADGAWGAGGAGRDVPPVSLPLLIAAGVVAVLELLMARWFSHAKVGGEGEVVKSRIDGVTEAGGGTAA